ncbi:uncharacterized protein LOC142476753 [Ascaphus truei]|uniref:uncharacterized protein LOC142476753 n=1 Tax=Ascaphus truei TaxID=8439 RepID=UPI003F59D92E
MPTRGSPSHEELGRCTCAKDSHLRSQELAQALTITWCATEVREPTSLPWSCLSHREPRTAPHEIETATGSHEVTNATVPDLPTTCPWPLKQTTAEPLSIAPTEALGATNNNNNGQDNSMGPSPSQVTPWTMYNRGADSSVGSNTTTSVVGNVVSSSSVVPVSSPANPGSSYSAVLGSSYTVAPGSASSVAPGSASSVAPTTDTLHLVLTPMTWAESRSYCRGLFTDLASVSAPDDQTKMAALLSGSAPRWGFWVGLRWNRFWGHWYWSGGQPWGEFIAWGDGEPREPLSQNCGLVSGDPARNLSWSSECCGVQLPFVCYREA